MPPGGTRNALHNTTRENGIPGEGSGLATDSPQYPALVDWRFTGRHIEQVFLTPRDAWGPSETEGGDVTPAGQTALQVGARSGSLGVVQELISHQANMSVSDKWGESEDSSGLRRLPR
ncbi:hypothetical protein E2C01_037558 [Portunus trituberculatus]|uniref:Uncharacterized protein n=1 Tax=Portunus trituberculatus TaxID=210409 RepID=A0A5B7FFM5_PORTR|nr:hypothetical protein [Portunus trituberculatus]